MCVFWGTQASCCVFWTSRDFMMRWLNCIKVKLVCLNSVVVSVYCCLMLVVLLCGCLCVEELMEAQEDIQVTSDLPLVSWKKLFKLFHVSEDLTVEIVFQSSVNSNLCLTVAEKIIYKGNCSCVTSSFWKNFHLLLYQYLMFFSVTAGENWSSNFSAPSSQSRKQII